MRICHPPENVSLGLSKSSGVNPKPRSTVVIFRSMLKPSSRRKVSCSSL